MQQRKSSIIREWEIVGLIDIIFLLIIFGVVIAVFVGSSAERQVPNTRPDFSSLSMRIVPTQRVEDGVVIRRLALDFVSAPFETHRVYFETDDRVTAMSLDNFEDTDAAAYIDECIVRYAEILDTGNDELDSRILVEAHPDAPMRIVSYIFRSCALNAPLIRSVDLVTVGSEEGGA